MGFYTIGNASEETGCAQCGYPLYIGDRALEAGDGDIYCGKRCEENAEELATENWPDETPRGLEPRRSASGLCLEYDGPPTRLAGDDFYFVERVRSNIHGDSS